MPLTAVAIRGARPGPKSVRLYDSGGLPLEITPAGGRWWRFAYRFGSKRKLLSLGVFQDVPLAAARGWRDVAREVLADGKDPSAERQAEKREVAARAGNSSEAVALTLFSRSVMSLAN